MAFNQQHRENIQQEISAIFARYNDAITTLFEKYGSGKGADGFTTTRQPLSDEDRKKFLEERRMVMAVLAKELPKIVKKNPDFLLSEERRLPYPAHKHGLRINTFDYDPSNGFIVTTFAFGKGQSIPIHSHPSSSMTYLIEGELFETEYGEDNSPRKSTGRNSGAITMSGPHTELANVDRHSVHSAGMHDISLMMTISDALCLQSDGRLTNTASLGEKKFLERFARDSKMHISQHTQTDLIPRR